MDIKAIVEQVKGQTIGTGYGPSVVEGYNEEQDSVFLLEHGQEPYALNPYDFVLQLNKLNGYNFELDVDNEYSDTDVEKLKEMFEELVRNSLSSEPRLREKQRTDLVKRNKIEAVLAKKIGSEVVDDISNKVIREQLEINK
ncbi:MAG: hypothetical protein ACOCQR_02185 [bacterium]